MVQHLTSLKKICQYSLPTFLNNYKYEISYTRQQLSLIDINSEEVMRPYLYFKCREVVFIYICKGTTPHLVRLGVFDWAAPNVSIISCARFFIRLVLRTNGSESSERTNVLALRVAKTAQITWHTKGDQWSSRFDFSGQRGSRFVLSVRLSMYHNLTSISL